MALSLEEKRAIVKYRIQKAQSTMIEAKDNANLKHWNLVANRLVLCGIPYGIGTID